MFGLALLGLATLFLVGRLVIALRRPAQRAALPRLIWSPVALVDAAGAAFLWLPLAAGERGTSAWLAEIVAVATLAVLGRALQEAGRDDRPRLDAFCRRHGFERWGRRRRMPRPWRRRQAADTVVVPEAWADAAEDLVANLRRLGGSIEVVAAAERLARRRSDGDRRGSTPGTRLRVAAWLDVRREAGEITIGRPAGHQVTRRREVRHEPRLTPPGLAVTISPEVAAGEEEELLRPLDLVHHPLAEGGELVLRLGPDGLLVALPRWRPEEAGFEALAELALAAAAAARPGSTRFAAYRP